MLKCRCLVLGLLAQLAAAHAGDAARTRRFAGSAMPLVNPERGFRGELADFPAMANLGTLAQFNITLAQVYSYMWQFCTTVPCQPLSSSYLAELDDGFARARGAGVKLLVRFAYENSSATPMNGPSTFEEIFGHMRQLQPVVARNADVIHTIAAGFVGAYGEWHSSVHRLEENHSALALLVQHELDWFLPPDRSIIIRTPAQKANLLRTWPQGALPPGFGWCIADAHVDRSQACMRLGFDNDGWGAGNTDGGTWATPYPPYGAADNSTGVLLPYNLPGNPEFDYMTRESPFLLVDGEPYAHNKGCRPSPHMQPMCSVAAGASAPHEAGSQAAARLRGHHYTSFSFARNCQYLTAEGKTCPERKYALDYWRETVISSDIVNRWHLPHSPAYPVYTATYLQYLTDHLGYRLELASASAPSSVAVGGALAFNFTLLNRGFAAPINPRPVLAVLVPAGTGTGTGTGTGVGASFRVDDADAKPVVLGAISTDVRSWQPHLPGDPYFDPIQHTLSFAVAELPAAVTAGAWRLGLYLPDARAEAHGSEARFAIRFANDDSGVGWWTAPGNNSNSNSNSSSGGGGGGARRFGVNTFANVAVG